MIAATAVTEALSNMAWYLKRAALIMYRDDADGASVFLNKVCDSKGAEVQGKGWGRRCRRSGLHAYTRT